MNDLGPESSFRGLPLSAEQEAEIQHYIHQRRRRGLGPDPAELRAMLKDMLEPPVDDELIDQFAAETQTNAERAANRNDDNSEVITAQEEFTAAIEAEAMKHQGS
ncbi:MAG: hypothetical protein K0R43_1563 [Pseudoduganella sp.]|jgi:hypothetical protein|nr:hypothetical protein [Pseudoduganella sp.]